jgi:hypothetical protein
VPRSFPAFSFPAVSPASVAFTITLTLPPPSAVDVAVGVAVGVVGSGVARTALMHVLKEKTLAERSVPQIAEGGGGGPR